MSYRIALPWSSYSCSIGYFDLFQLFDVHMLSAVDLCPHDTAFPSGCSFGSKTKDAERLSLSLTKVAGSISLASRSSPVNFQ